MDTLLEVPEVGSLLSSLSDRFVGHFLMLVPDLPAEDRDALSGAAREAFDPTAVRTNVAYVIAAVARDEDVCRLLQVHRTGAQARLRRAVAAYETAQTFEEFGANLANIDRDRLQLMASFIEVKHLSEVELIADEALRQLAHNRGCMAVGRVRVELLGSEADHETPNSFIVRNRCGANAFMAAPGVSSLVAARIHYALTTFPGDERRVPSC